METNVAVHAKPTTEEVLFHEGDVSLCLMINRRTRSLRVVDFRAGPHPKKRQIVERVARDEGLERIFTVVEREEAPSWLRLGFHKEGSIPGFYKRSDAYLLGFLMESDEEVAQSGTRLALHARPEHAIADRAERAYQAGRRMMRTKAPEVLPAVKVQKAREQDVLRSLSHAGRSGRALTELEPFGRGVQREAYLCTARGGFSLLVSVETQPCFDNALVEPLTAPRSEKETWLTAAGLRQVGDLLRAQGLVSAFAISVADSVPMTAALVVAGFRRTGRLPKHMMVQGERHDAFLWSRKLADLATD